MHVLDNYPRVVVLILSYNNKLLLEDSVTSYLANDYPNFEVVVIDNGSTDNTKGYINDLYPYVEVIRIENNLGYSGGFNIGLEVAFKNKGAAYVLISNNDVKADTKVISKLVQVAESNEKIGFVTGKVYYFDQPEILQTVGKVEHPIFWNGGHIGNCEKDELQYEKITERAFADDVFCLVRSELYHKIGGYDETFFLQSEEFDWQARSKAHGYMIYYTPYAKIWHKDSKTIGRQSFTKIFYNARNPMLVVFLHKDGYFFRRYLWNHFIYRILKPSIINLFKLNLYYSLALWCGFLSGLFWIIRKGKA